MTLNSVAELRSWMNIPDSVETAYLTLISESIESELALYAGGALPAEGGALARYRVAHARLVQLDVEWDRVMRQGWGETQSSYESDYNRMRHTYLTQIRWRGTED